MFSREARRRNKERLLQATGIHKETKDDEAFVAKLEASKNLEKRLDDARRCVYEYSLALHALSDKSASLATALAALSDDAHGDAQQALNELQTHEIKLRRTHAPAACMRSRKLAGAPLDAPRPGPRTSSGSRKPEGTNCWAAAPRGARRRAREAARRPAAPDRVVRGGVRRVSSRGRRDGALRGRAVRRRRALPLRRRRRRLRRVQCAVIAPRDARRDAWVRARRTPLHWNTGRRSLLPSPRRPPDDCSRARDRDAAARGAARCARTAAAPPPPAARVAPPVLPARPTQEVTAAYAYQGQRASDLSFAAGDVIVVTRKKANGWWVGHVRGRDPATAGEFPSNYVR